MSLVDLKYSKAEAKEEAAEMSKPQSPEYSWGLSFRLEKEELDKLGVADLPDVGDTWNMTIVVDVTSVSQQKMAGGDDEACVCLQIIKAEIAAPAEKAAPKAPTKPKADSAPRKTASLLSPSGFKQSAGTGFTKPAYLTSDEA